MTEQHIEIWTDYHAFVLHDNGEARLHQSAGEDVEGLSVIGPSAAFVRIGRNGKLPTTIKVLRDASKCSDTKTWMVVSECSLNFPSGKVCIAGTTDIPDEHNLVALTPGWYRIRIYFNTIDGPEFDYDIEDEEDVNKAQGQCLIELWPAEYWPIRSIKAVE